MINALGDYLFFVAIVEHGSITSASHQLGIPKSKLSRRLTQLEKRLGAQLLKRTTRKQSLTDTGRLLYHNCKPHVDALEDVEALVNSTISKVSGKLKLLLPLEFFNKVISTLVTDFALKYPALEIHCHHYSHFQTSIDQAYDLVFVLHEQALPSLDWVGRSLLSFPQSVYVAQHSELRELSKASQLEEIQAIFANEQEAWLFRSDGEIRMVRPKASMVFSSPEMRVAACQRGIGLLKLPDYIGEQNPAIAPLALAEPLVAQQLTVLYQGRNIPAKTRVFLDYFQSNIGCLS